MGSDDNEEEDNSDGYNDNTTESEDDESLVSVGQNLKNASILKKNFSGKRSSVNTMG